MKIAIIGYGKMGKAIEQLAIEGGHEVVLKISTDNQEDLTERNLKTAEVAIEFSRPDSAFENIKRCLEAGLPVISGTTGWLDKLGEAKTICRAGNAAFLYASNFSIGVNIFFAVNKYLAGMMNGQPQYEPEIQEIHHVQKLDAPSGTAISLADQIIEKLDRKSNWRKERAADPKELAIQSKRIEQVAGKHHVHWQSEIDSIEIIHTAHSREGFARGALQAAEWIIGRKGCFEMSDLLGF